MVSGSKLVTMGFGKKYSILSKFDNKVYYIIEVDNEGYNALTAIKNEAEKEGSPVYLITKKKVQYPPEILKGFKKLEEGQKYELYMR